MTLTNWKDIKLDKTVEEVRRASLTEDATLPKTHKWSLGEGFKRPFNKFTENPNQKVYVDTTSKYIKTLDFNESVEKPVERIKEGVGAGYYLRFFDLKLIDIKIKDMKKVSEHKEFNFTANVIPGEYDWEAEHPYWYVGKDSYDLEGYEPIWIDGGTVEGHGECWPKWDANDEWTEDELIDEIAFEEYTVSVVYSAGWLHNDIVTPLELEDRGRAINDNNDYEIIKVTLDLDVSCKYLNNMINHARDPEEDPEDEEEYDEDFDESKKSDKTRFNEKEKSLTLYHIAHLFEELFDEEEIKKSSTTPVKSSSLKVFIDEKNDWVGVEGVITFEEEDIPGNACYVGYNVATQEWEWEVKQQSPVGEYGRGYWAEDSGTGWGNFVQSALDEGLIPQTAFDKKYFKIDPSYKGKYGESKKTDKKRMRESDIGFIFDEKSFKDSGIYDKLSDVYGKKIADIFLDWVKSDAYKDGTFVISYEWGPESAMISSPDLMGFAYNYAELFSELDKRVGISFHNGSPFGSFMSKGYMEKSLKKIKTTKDDVKFLGEGNKLLNQLNDEALEESRRHPDPNKWKKGDCVIYKGKRYATSLFMGGDKVKLENHEGSIVVPQSEVYKATKKEINESKKSDKSDCIYIVTWRNSNGEYKTRKVKAKNEKEALDKLGFVREPGYHNFKNRALIDIKTECNLHESNMKESKKSDKIKLEEDARDYIKIGNRVYPNQASEEYANMSTDAALRKAKSNYEKEEAEKAEAARKAELSKKAEHVLAEIQADINSNKDGDSITTIMFGHLVPQSGKADTVAGEIIRAIERIRYRDFNDGDVFYDGYGKETCGSDAVYLTEVTPFEEDIIDIAENQYEGEEYTQKLDELADKIGNYILENTYLLAEPNENDCRSGFDGDYFDDYVLTETFDCDFSGYLENYEEHGCIDSGDYEERLECFCDDHGLDYYTNVHSAWGGYEIVNISKRTAKELEQDWSPFIREWLRDLEGEFGSIWDLDREEDEDYDEEEEEDEE